MNPNECEHGMLARKCEICEYEREIAELRADVERLNCNSVACHYKRDVLDSIYEAMTILPCNGIQAILCAAAQEIQALRQENKVEE